MRPALVGTHIRSITKIGFRYLQHKKSARTWSVLILQGDIMRKFDFENKVAVVTGASSGIGREICRILTQEYGCRVFGVARRVKVLEAMREELGPDRFLCCCMDASDEKSWEKLANYFKNTDTSPDVLINCAGILPKFSSVQNEAAGVAEKVMEINYFSAVYACRHIGKMLGDGGMIINVSSASALCPFAGVGAYSASKAALERYTECLAREETRISVSVALPGFVKTEIMKNQDINQKDEQLIAHFSKSPEKVARKILKRGAKRKKRTVIGVDGHFMSVMYRLFPNFAPWLFSKTVKGSKRELFKDI